MNTTHRVSGRQLTTIVVAICAAVVLAPVGVYAAAHTKVSIVDSKHPTRGATVTSTGAQLVTGSLSVTGTPTVSTRPGAATTPYYGGVSVAPSTEPVSVTVPAGKKLVLTSVSANVDDATGLGVPLIGIEVHHAGTEYLFSFPVTYVYTTASLDFYTAMLTTNLTLSPGDKIDAYGDLPSGEPSVGINLSGYLT